MPGPVVLLAAALVASALLAGCAPYRGYYFKVRATPTAQVESNPAWLSSDDMQTAREIVKAIAAAHGLEEAREDLSAAVTPDANYMLFNGTGDPRNPRAVSRRMFTISVFTAADYSSVEIGISDWRGSGERPLLLTVKSEIESCLRQAFPSYEIRVEPVDLGSWPP